MLKQSLQSDQIKALKNKDSLKLTTLRYILAQIKNKEIEKKADLSDDEIVAVLRKNAKEIRESIESFKKGNRQDLVEEYQKQLEVASQYLPAEITDEELKKEIDRIIADNQSAYQKNPKVIIGLCMKALKTKAEPSRIMKILTSLNK